MRILEVLFSFRVGGSEIVGLELAKQLADRGAEVYCTAIDGMEGPLVDRCAAYGIRLVDIGLPKFGVLSRNGISLETIQKIRSLKLSSIHLQHFLSLNKLGLAARIAGVPRIVVTEHSEATLKESAAASWRLRMNWRLAHTITVIHEGLKNYLVRNIGVDPGRIDVIQNGVDTSYWHRQDRDAQRVRLGITEKEFVFIYVGRLATIKNVPDLVDAFIATTSRNTKPLRLLIVGDGEDHDEARRRARAAPMITFCGEQNDVRSYLAAADSFVMNSTWEGTPRALMEAMAMGLPCICPSVGGIPEMLAGRGWLVSPGSSEELVLAMSAAATDSSLAGDYGRNAMAHAAGMWSAASIAMQYESLLRP